MESHHDAFKEVAVGRSLEELTTPRSPLMPRVEILDGTLLEIESSLLSSVPEEIRKRIAVTRNLAVYGVFCYDFVTVSVFWSFTCLEMALWAKFTDLHPGPLSAVKSGKTETIMAKDLASRLKIGYRIAGMPKFNGSFRSLVNWAFDQKLLPENESLDAIVNLRNSFAHPKELSSVVPPAMAVDAFQKLVEIVNQLWPLELAS